MLAVLTVLFVLAISLLVIRVATVGLTLTGLSRDLAEFQSISAFTRSGFTTREAEEIVNHPVRRRIIMLLMLTGNAGIVIGMVSLLLSFLGTGAEPSWYSSTWFRITVLSVGIVAFWALASSRTVERAMWNLNSWAVRRWARLDVRDYMGLLRVTGDYAVWELQVHEGDWLADQALSDLQLPREGVLVLGIDRGDGHYIGAPQGATRIHAGDSLILYGRQDNLQDLDDRRAGMEGNLDHVIAVTRQQGIREEEIAPTEEQQEGE